MLFRSFAVYGTDSQRRIWHERNNSLYSSVVFEVKYSRSAENLAKNCEQAVRQIDRRMYAEGAAIRGKYS